MQLVKLSLFVAVAAAFTIACGKPAANIGTGNNATASNAASNAANSGASNAATPAPTKDPAKAGADLYTVNCITCHKDSGKGGKVTVEGKTLNVEDLTADKKKQRSDEKLAQDIGEGAESDGMPAFKEKLTADEIELVVAHLRTLQSK